MDIHYHGHSCFELSDGSTTVLVDPFLKPNNPLGDVTADDVNPTHIAITHGHVDHMADALPVAERTGAHLVAIGEIVNWFGQRGIENTSDPNLGGVVEFDWGWICPGLRGGSVQRRARDADGDRSRDACPHRRQDRLPRGRYMPVQRHEADRRA